MSYNCDSVNEIVLNATMQANYGCSSFSKRARTEVSFLYDMEDAALKAKEEKDLKREIPLPIFSWCSIGSGRSMDFLEKKVVPKIKGEVEAIFYWEGGDAIDGLLVKNGKCVRVGVEQRLIKPEGW